MLYRLNENSDTYSKLERVMLKDIGWTEKDLENLFVNNIQDFVSSDDLMVIFTERSGQEEPDVIAIDKNGELYLFELKRWTSKEENLLQVLRYGQLFGKSTYYELNELYKKYTKNANGNLAEDHALYFQYDKDKILDEDKFNTKQHFLIVTNGLDQKTAESISFWKSNGLNIDAIIYWVFKISNQCYIEFNTYSYLKDSIKYENNCYVVNTNKKNNPNNTLEMITEQKVAAYYPGWREKIKKLQKGDIVFLYENGVGIIAYGNASGKLEKRPCDGHDDYEYNMHLDEFVKLSKPVSASKMKEITQCGFNFRQTMFSISDEAKDKILKHIDGSISK